MKLCTRCKTVKEETEFNKRIVGHGGLNSRCKSCVRALAKILRDKDPQYHLDQGYKWRKENPEKTKIMNKRADLKKAYGLSLEDYNELFENQRGCCAVCSQLMVPWPCVDHSHATGKVRALLCQKCNFGIGQFNDSPQLCNLAAAYLQKYV